MVCSMSNAISEPKPRPSRFSRFSARDTLIRLAAIVSDRDDELVVHLRLDGFRIEPATPDDVERTAHALAAEALLVDADIPGALQAVARLRRGEGVLSTIPIVLVADPAGALRTSLDAIESGGDVFAPRPVDPADLAARLRDLLEIPGIDHAAPPSSPAPPAIPRVPVHAAGAAAHAAHDDGSGAMRANTAPGFSAPLSGSAANPRAPAGLHDAPLPASLAPPPHPAPAPSPEGHRGGAAATGLSPGLAEVLRSAAVRAGGSEADLVLPSLDDEAIDELIPPELLEPLDAPIDAIGEEAQLGPQHTPPPFQHGASIAAARDRRSSSRGMPAIHPRGSATPTITPLALGGELRLAGPIGPFGVGAVLGAASRARASGLVIVRTRGVEYALSVTSGHLLAIRSSRSDDDIGPLLVRLGAIPREAARFAASPLDAGVRGAALVASRGYLTAEALAQALGRAARELTFDLLTVSEGEWEMRPLETAVEIPLAPRSLDALVVLGARARLEPPTALEALGGREVTVSLKSDAAALAPLPLTRTEREAALAARSVKPETLAETYGSDVLPALLALAWLGVVRVDGPGAPALLAPPPVGALAQERTRVRALVEAAQSRDYFALLGVSEWSTRRAALEGLEARRTEFAGIRSRHPDAPGLDAVAAVLDELATMHADAGAWERYVAALRARSV
jgi:hypothetical protein